jgi:hypothetical protein
MKKDRAKRIPVVSMLNRREVLGFLGGTAAVSLVGCLRGQSASVETGTSTQTLTRTAIATTPTCVVRPQQTEGPSPISWMGSLTAPTSGQIPRTVQ